MKRYNGGTKVGGGYYFNLKSWEVANIEGKEGTLPGEAKDTFLHAPLPVLFVVAPVLGIGFAMFLPLIGFVMPVYALVKRMKAAGAEAAATMTPAWQPGEAYLAGKPEEKKAAPKEELEKLAKEIDERRAERR
jgi:hypothetical protein